VSASGLVSWVKCHDLSRKIIGSYDVRTPHHDPLAGSLSGGNLQKFMIGREMMSRPRLLIVAQPTWGVDIGAAQAIRAAMRTLLEDGTAIIIISQDLEELLVMSHRICVLNQGQLSEPLPAQDVTAESIGLMMGGITNSVSERAV
jgi:simple sugar transport system ATP-binding protein